MRHEYMTEHGGQSQECHWEIKQRAKGNNWLIGSAGEQMRMYETERGRGGGKSNTQIVGDKGRGGGVCVCSCGGGDQIHTRVSPHGLPCFLKFSLSFLCLPISWVYSITLPCLSFTLFFVII